MRNLKISGFFCIFSIIAMILYAANGKSQTSPPPWMENADIKGRANYLVPIGAKKKKIGSQVVVESPNEYVARRLYEMERYLEERFAQIERNQEALKSGLEELKKALNEVKKDQRELEDQVAQE